MILDQAGHWPASLHWATAHAVNGGRTQNGRTLAPPRIRENISDQVAEAPGRQGGKLLARLLARNGHGVDERKERDWHDICAIASSQRVPHVLARQGGQTRKEPSTSGLS